MASVTGLLKSRVLRPLNHKVLVPAGEGVGRVVLERKMQNTRVDPGIRYPCYKSFDDLIDVERLNSLDAYVTSKIEEHDAIFYSGFLTLKATSPKQPGSRIIELSGSKTPRGSYFDLDKADLWAISDEANEFPLLMDFIATLLSKPLPG